MSDANGKVFSKSIHKYFHTVNVLRHSRFMMFNGHRSYLLNILLSQGSFQRYITQYEFIAKSPNPPDQRAGIRKENPIQIGLQSPNNKANELTWDICVRSNNNPLLIYEGKVKSYRPSLRETRDKRPLDPDRGFCYRYTSAKLSWSQLMNP